MFSCTVRNYDGNVYKHINSAHGKCVDLSWFHALHGHIQHVFTCEKALSIETIADHFLPQTMALNTFDFTIISYILIFIYCTTSRYNL